MTSKIDIMAVVLQLGQVTHNKYKRTTKRIINTINYIDLNKYCYLKTMLIWHHSVCPDYAHDHHIIFVHLSFSYIYELCQLNKHIFSIYVSFHLKSLYCLTCFLITSIQSYHSYEFHKYVNNKTAVLPLSPYLHLFYYC